MSESKQAISTDQAPAAVGAYSQAVKAGGFLFLSGQIAIDPGTGRFMQDADVSAQARRVMQNLQAVLEAGGSSFDAVVKATIFLADIADFKAVNAIYAEYFAEGVKPARAAVQAGALPLGAKVEIEMIALAPAGSG